jgi:hypothetical protein
VNARALTPGLGLVDDPLAGAPMCSHVQTLCSQFGGHSPSVTDEDLCQLAREHRASSRSAAVELHAVDGAA